MLLFQTPFLLVKEKASRFVRVEEAHRRSPGLRRASDVPIDRSILGESPRATHEDAPLQYSTRLTSNLYFGSNNTPDILGTSTDSPAKNSNVTKLGSVDDLDL